MICKRSIRSHCSVLLQTIFLSTLVLVPLNAHAKTPVWKITKGDNHLYLGGTIHVLSRADYPLPAAFDATFATADEVIFETDVAALSRPAVQKELLSVMKFQDERTLADVLDDDTLAKLKAFLSDRSIAYTQFADFTPAGLSMTLVPHVQKAFQSNSNLKKLCLVGHSLGGALAQIAAVDT
ncbi:MAG: TraB/GumN family protein, partial [Pseudomonadota bacterium]